jgi:nicotinamidase-related amidase
VNTSTYDKGITALVVVDPYNDFISEGGKLWPRIKAVAEANNCAHHMLEVLNAARKAKLRVFYAMHHRYRPGDVIGLVPPIPASKPPSATRPSLATTSRW